MIGAAPDGRYPVAGAAVLDGLVHRAGHARERLDPLALAPDAGYRVANVLLNPFGAGALLPAALGIVALAAVVVAQVALAALPLVSALSRHFIISCNACRSSLQRRSAA